MIRILSESFIVSAFWLLVLAGIVCVFSGCHTEGTPREVRAFMDWAAGNVLLANVLLIAFLGLYSVIKFHLEPKSIGPTSRRTKSGK